MRWLPILVSNQAESRAVWHLKAWLQRLTELTTSVLVAEGTNLSYCVQNCEPNSSQFCFGCQIVHSFLAVILFLPFLKVRTKPSLQAEPVSMLRPLKVVHFQNRVEVQPCFENENFGHLFSKLFMCVLRVLILRTSAIRSFLLWL